MAKAKITLIGFYNYMQSLNDDLFGNLTTPDGIDRQLLINNILFNYGEFEVMYADPYFMKNMIGIWSDKWQFTMTKWLEAITAEFNPVENYDRIENWTDNLSRDKTGKVTDKTTKDETVTAHDDSTSSGSGKTTNTRSAYDSGTYQPHDESSSSSSGTNRADSSTTAKGTTNDTVDSKDNEKSLSKHDGRIHGNIGVKTAQSMIEESLELYKFNVYDAIASLFATELCIYVY